MRLLLAGTGMLAALCCVAFAQTFEIADIRSSPPDSSPYMHGGNRSMSSALLPNGRYEIRDATMAELIETAWGISAEEIAGGPNWLESDRFDVTAKVPAGADRANLPAMLRPFPVVDLTGLVGARNFSVTFQAASRLRKVTLAFQQACHRQ